MTIRRVIPRICQLKLKNLHTNSLVRLGAGCSIGFFSELITEGGAMRRMIYIFLLLAGLCSLSLPARQLTQRTAIAMGTADLPMPGCIRAETGPTHPPIRSDSRNRVAAEV